MKIGDLAQATETTVETIRYYEREGLLPGTSRTGGNYRIYAKAHVDRLLFIRHCRGLDMPLNEIRELLRIKDHPNENCRAVNDMLDKHIDLVAARVRELRQLDQQLKALRKLCGGSLDADHCGILKELTHAARKTSAPKIPAISRRHKTRSR